MSDPTIPDSTGWTLAQFEAAIQQLQQEYYAAQRAQHDTAEARKAAIGAAATDLETLLGPVDAPKTTGNIRGARQFTGAEMAAGAEVTLPLIFAALEILTDTTLDLARAVNDR